MVTKKKDVNWVLEAPQKNCSTCCNVRRVSPKPYVFQHVCKKHNWVTKAKSICDDWAERGTTEEVTL